MASHDLPPCRLYLASPAGLSGTAELAVFADHLAAALEAAEIACLLLRTEGLSGEAVAGAAEAVVPLAHRHDVAVLLEGMLCRDQCPGTLSGLNDDDAQRDARDQSISSREMSTLGLSHQWEFTNQCALACDLFRQLAVLGRIHVR